MINQQTQTYIYRIGQLYCVADSGCLCYSMRFSCVLFSVNFSRM